MKSRRKDSRFLSWPERNGNKYIGGRKRKSKVLLGEIFHFLFDINASQGLLGKIPPRSGDDEENAL